MQANARVPCAIDFSLFLDFPSRFLAEVYCSKYYQKYYQKYCRTERAL